MVIFIFSEFSGFLKNQGLKLEKIRLAYDYLNNLNSDKPLTAYSIYHDGKDVFEVTDQLRVILSRYGQLAFDGVIQVIPVGTELERTRLAMKRTVTDLKNRLESAQKAKAWLHLTWIVCLRKRHIP